MLKSFKQLIEAKEFGEVIFGEFRGLEDDNEREADIYRLVMDFIKGEYMASSTSTGVNAKIDGELVKAFEDLMKVKKDYKELKPLSVPLYRGTKWKEKDFKKRSEFWKLFEGSANVINVYGANFIKSKKKMKIKFPTEITSFTTNLSIATSFAEHQEFISGFFPIVFTVDRPNKDFIFTSDLMNQIQKETMVGGTPENEVIRFTKNKNMDALVYMKPRHVYMSYLFYKMIELVGLSNIKHIGDFRDGSVPIVLKYNGNNINIRFPEFILVDLEIQGKNPWNHTILYFKNIKSWNDIKKSVDSLIKQIVEWDYK